MAVSEKSQRAQEVWKRFGAWYGADVLERKYGLKAPPDWVLAIGAVPEGLLESVMADVHLKFPQWPPTLADFEQVARTRSARASGPSNIDRLSSHLEHMGLSNTQLRGRQWITDGLQIIGVVVPRDGISAGHRIMMEDLS